MRKYANNNITMSPPLSGDNLIKLKPSKQKFEGARSQNSVSIMIDLIAKNDADLRPVSIAALLVARAQRLTLRHAQQENNEVRNDRELSYGS